MKKIIILIGFICAARLGAAAVNSSKDSLKLKLETSVPRWMQELKVPGVGIAVIEEGKISWTKVFGELEKGRPAPQDAIFNTASVGKTFTALVALKMVSDKQWDLDVPLANYWIDEDVRNHKWLRKLTTRHVLSHRSGFKNWRHYSPQNKLDFDFEPGTANQYSGEGMEYLQRALENKFKKSLDRLVYSLIFKPAGMRHSQYWSPKLDMKKFAYSHDVDGQIYRDINYSKSVSGAGNIHTTTGDMAKFIVFMLEGARLSPELYQQMISHQDEEGKNEAFGLGWGVIKNLPGGEYALKHGGDDKGVHAMVVILPKSKRGIVVLTNGDNGALLIQKTIREMVDIFPSSANPDTVKLENNILDKYAGTYLQTDNRKLLVERTGDVLKISAEGVPLMELTPQSSNKFFVKDLGIALEFIEKDVNQVKVNIYQEGKLVMEAERKR